MNINQPGLFDDDHEENHEPAFFDFDKNKTNKISEEFYSSDELNDLEELYEISASAYTTVINAEMNENFPKPDLKRYIQKIMNAVCETERSLLLSEGRKTKADIQLALRAAAENAAFDRGDELVRKILNASCQAGHEIHRIMGLLRFNPNNDGMWIARCEPDHYILPALSAYFFERFGDDAWAIIDEKRGITLVRLKNEEPVFGPLSAFPFLQERGNAKDEWEDLWRSYHNIVNIESRKNPGLQRQCMPARYWKYLPEKK